MSLISPSRCRPALSIFFRSANKPFLSEIGRVLLQNFAVADDGIERRAQLVAHIGEELRLVLPRHFELPAFILDFAEQPRVLNRQHRLRRESLDQVDGVLRKGAGRAAADHQHANDILAAHERRQQRAHGSRRAG